MLSRDLPDRWKHRLGQYTDEKYGLDYAHRGKLSAYDFSSFPIVHIRFPDGSFALFRYAFFITMPEWKEVAVFTEHCGYHIFPLVDLQIEKLESMGEALDEDKGI